MFHLAMLKPDGRELILYGRSPIVAAAAPQAAAAGERAAHLRWHPLRGEWVAYAAHRQARTYLPPAEHDPLAPAELGRWPTEVPAGNWDVAVFENLFSALGGTVPAPREIVATAPSGGRTEVVVFTQDATGSLGGLSLSHLEIVIEVWADRTRALRANGAIRHVLPFENRGVEVGVTLPHPHGQLYAYPFVPPVIERELELQRAHFERYGAGLFETLMGLELASGQRVLCVEPHAVAWVPVCARWAYEIWVAPRRRVATLDALEPEERRDLARCLKRCLLKLDGLWQRTMPYVLVAHQAPLRGDHAYVHLHWEIYPFLRMPERLKYLAGSEIGAGVFTADTLPEDKARELREVEVP